MLDIAPTELILVALVALVVIGPKDLPKAMRVVGYWVGRARSVTRQFRSGFDAMVREAELAEMEKKWAEENARIMREHPGPTPAPLPAPADDETTPHGETAPQNDAGEGSDAVEHADTDMPAPSMVEKPVILDEHGEDEAPAPEREAGASDLKKGDEA